MSKPWIPEWATHYQIIGNPAGVLRCYIEIEFCDADDSRIRDGWEPIHTLPQALAISDVCQQIRENGANQVNPTHYKQGGVECIDAIQAALTPDEFRGYCKGNVIKYTWRERYKQGRLAMQKAGWYLDRLLQVMGD